MKTLTKAEEQIMQVLWESGEGFVKEIRQGLPDPKPAYNTVSTIVRILEEKGFVAHKTYGRSHQYYPLVSKKEYSKSRLHEMLSNYFGNSFRELVSFFAKENDLSLNELEELIQDVQQDIDKNKNK
jgi:predicted transcriptional regulator